MKKPKDDLFLCPHCNKPIADNLITARSGRIGGKKTALRGSQYFRDLAAQRKTRAGGRPRKRSDQPASPFAKIVRAVPTVITGNPDPNEICTSHVERNNLTMRTFLRRLTGLSLGFSKKLENLKHAVALHFAFYNFCRVHKSLRATPAMAAGLADHVWTLSELLRVGA